MTDYTSVVRAGIEFLDRNYVGDWRKKIDLDGLDISSCTPPGTQRGDSR